MEFISERVAGIVPSASMSASEKVRELAKKGRRIINLSVGEPDFDTPSHIVEAAVKALYSGETRYTDSRGIEELRNAVCLKLKNENNISADPNSEVLITPGAKQAIVYALLATVNPGDEVLIPEPYWLSYVDCVKLAGGLPVGIPSLEEAGFKITQEDLLRRISPRTKVLILNNPVNPTGVVLGKDDLEMMVKVAIKHNLLVISDETYEKIIFDGLPCYSIAAFAGMAERTITVNGFSKTYAMTGWRLGYLTAAAPLLAQILKVHQHTATCAAAFAQRAAVAALQGSQAFVEMMVEEYRNRRDLLMEGIETIDFISTLLPRGTFYAFLNIKKLEMTSVEAAGFILDQALVATTPGSAYGISGEGYLRISFSTSRKNLREALDRIANVLVKRS